MGRFIHNASFMMERGREPEFLEWFATAAPLRDTECNRVTAMREAGGIDYRHAEAQTVAWQCEFDTIEEAKAWSAETFAGVAARFREKFGPDAIVFTSIFETADI